MDSSKCLMPSNYQFKTERRPFNHQARTVRFMLANHRAYLWLDMGTGKTATTLWFLDLLFDYGKVKKVLVIAPLSTLELTWFSEVREVCPNREAVILHHPNRDERLRLFKSDNEIFIINHDGVRNFHKELTTLNPDIIVIDEITAFSNSQSARSKCLQKLCSNAKAVYGLSGDPVAGGLLNSYGIAKVVNPSRLPNKFFTRYRDMISYPITMYEREYFPHALQIVNDALSPAIKIAIEECVDLPPITFQTRRVDAPKEAMDLFKEMLNEQIAEYKGGLITAATAGVCHIRLIQILNGFTKTNDGELKLVDMSPKLRELHDIYFESGCKLVVFAQSVPTVKLLLKFFRDKGIKSELIYGDVSPSERKRIVDDFQSGGDGVLVAQVRTMSHGITLTASNTICFFGPVSGNEAFRQAIRRIRRIGQTKPQRIVKLVCSKFEEWTFQKLDDRQSIGQAMLELYENPKDAI